MLHEITHALAPLIWGGLALTFLVLRHQHKMAEINAGHGAPSPTEMPHGLTAAHTREVAQLRERVRVLERIATDAARHDSAHALAAQIDALKD